MSQKNLFNYLAMMVSQSAHKVIRFLIMLFVIRQSGVDLWGQAILLMTWVAYGLTILDWGQSPLSAVHSLSDSNEEQNLLNLHFWKHSAAGLFFCSLFAVIYAWNQQHIWLYLGIYSSISFMKALAPEWVYYRNQKPGLLHLLLTMRSIFQILLLIFAPIQLTILTFIFSELLAELLFVVSTMIWRASTSRLQYTGFSLEKVRAFLQKSHAVFLMTLAVFLHTNADIFILGWITDSITVGVYATNYRIMLFYYMVGGALSIIYRTRAATFLQTNSTENLKVLVVSNWKVLFLMSSFFVAMTSSFLKPFMLIIFHNQDVVQHSILNILSIYVVISFVSIILSETLLASGARILLLKIVAVGALFNISLNLLLIPLFGGHGAALATLIAELLLLALFWKSTQQSLSLRVSFHSLWLPLFVFTVLILISFAELSLALKTIIALGVWSTLLLSGWFRFSDLKPLLSEKPL